MAAPDIAPLDQSSLRDGAYAALSDAFARGAYAPGDTVSLRDLAERLGVSMTPVREAVRRLVAEGALVDTPRRSLAVPAWDERRLVELKSARLALERLLLDQALERATPDDLATLRALIAAPGRDADGTPDLRANHAFHMALYRIGGSAVILPMVRALWLQYGAYLGQVVHSPAAADVAEHEFHHRIVDALARGDRDTAHAALTLDVERSFQFLLSEKGRP
ncbi:GntR family transcriptional regulator [Rhodobacteraceae bacterium CCMM004]|nr:GntR family transcriptional regulator [Rhodobacteraceae bacterium CCMM004]